ncbi:MAG: HAMP domain-containing histidine kinase [Bacteroidales bacterium]|nr:HAMP domain-containing histidine kinase [Bacteroidales bacterium]
MKLVYKLTLTFIVPLVVTLGLWGWLSYRTMERKIHADTDMILKDYASDIIMRKLSGQELPDRFNGAYNTYYIKEVSPEYAEANQAVVYEDAEAFLRSQEDFASSRVRKQVFVDKDGRHYEIAVSLPTFEQETLVEHVLVWTVVLFVVLLVAMLVISVLVLNYNMRPFEALLRWMDEYVPGEPGKPVPSDTDVLEFRKLASVAQQTVERFERQYEERKLFIGNVSHELQTPLAACSNRLELILDRQDLDEETAEELVKLHRSLQHLIRLNRTLLLLTKIENGQFPEVTDVDLGRMLSESMQMYDEMYSYKEVTSSFSSTGDLTVSMNEQMASVLVGNLVKNAYVHSPHGGGIKVEVRPDGFTVSNPGTQALDGSRLFRRFYQPSGRKEGSTGLGLALAYSVCERNGMALAYEYAGGRHQFAVKLKKLK